MRNTGFQRPCVSPRRMSGRHHGPGRLSKQESFGYTCPGSRLNEVFRYLIEYLFMLDGGKFNWVHGRSQERALGNFVHGLSMAGHRLSCDVNSLPW